MGGGKGVFFPPATPVHNFQELCNRLLHIDIYSIYVVEQKIISGFNYRARRDRWKLTCVSACGQTVKRTKKNFLQFKRKSTSSNRDGRP